MKSDEKNIYQRLGILSHTNTKYRAIMNMRYWLNELRVVKIHDIKTLNEMKDFVRHPNNTWSGRTANTLDDRVMSLVWALIALENDLCGRYFEVIKYDDNLRPQVIKSLDYGFKTVVSPIGSHHNEADQVGMQPAPVIFQTDNNSEENQYADNADLHELYEQGWRMPEINTKY